MFNTIIAIALLSVPADCWNNEQYWKNAIPGRVIVQFDNTIDVDQSLDYNLNIGSASIVYRSKTKGNFIEVEVEKDIDRMKEFIKWIEKQPHVEFAEPVHRRYAHYFQPNDPGYLYYDQWGLGAMFVQYAWGSARWPTDVTAIWYPTDTKIGFVDGGIDYTHDDLEDRFGNIKGYDVLNNDNDPMPEDTVGAGYNHGTSSAGVAVATMDNKLGIAGIAQPQIYSIRVMDDYGNTDPLKIADGIRWAVDSGDVDIISISMGGEGYSQTERNACIYAWNNGCLLIASAGNSNSSTSEYPAAYDEVMAISAIDRSLVLWYEDQNVGSNYGTHIELCAPGDSILSTIPDNDYQYYDGTSLAAPAVSGVAALVWAKDSSLTNQNVRDILNNTAMDLGTNGWDQYYGHGLVDAWESVISVEGRGICFNDDGKIHYQLSAGQRYGYVSEYFPCFGTSFKVNELWIGLFTPQGYIPYAHTCYVLFYDSEHNPDRMFRVNLPAYPSSGYWGWLNIQGFDNWDVVFDDVFYVEVILYNGIPPYTTAPYLICDLGTQSDRNFYTYHPENTTPPNPSTTFYDWDDGDFMFRVAGETAPSGNISMSDSPEANKNGITLETNIVLGEQIPVQNYTTEEIVFTHTNTEITGSSHHAFLKNHPDPFIDRTEIQCNIPHASHVTVKIYNITGSLVTTLINAQMDAGVHTVSWDGKDSSNRKLSAGVYFCQLETDETILTKKIIRIK